MKSLFAIAGTAIALAHLVISISAIPHLRNDESVTDSDRTFGWAFYWFLESDKYSENCRKLQLAALGTFVSSAACWIAWFFVD